MNDIFVPKPKNSTDTSYHWDRKELYGSMEEEPVSPKAILPSKEKFNKSSNELVSKKKRHDRQQSLDGFDYTNVSELVAANNRLASHSVSSLDIASIKQAKIKTKKRSNTVDHVGDV